MIEIEEIGDWKFKVTVSQIGSTTHTVSVDRDYYEKLTSSEVPVELLVEKSFDFLLERESSSSILREFNLSVISRYFPEYEREIKQMVRGDLE
jgi:hypothetical protein